MAGEVRPPLHLLFSVGPTQEFENAAGHYPKQAGAFVGLHSEFPDREGIVKHAEGEMSERGEMQSGSFELDCISQGTGRGPQENQHLISPVDGASEIGMPQPGSVEACGKSDEQKLSAVSGAVEVSAVATAGLPSFVALQLLDCPTQETGGSERNGGVPGRAAECEPQPRETKDFPQGMACRTSGTPNQTEGPPEEAKLLRIGPAIKDRNEEAGKEGGEREGEERRELGEEEREGEVPAESERPCETRDDALNQAVPEERWRLPFSQGLTQVEARESWGLGRSGRLENEVPVEEQSKWGGVAAVATKESEAAGEGVNTGALRRGECGQEKMAGDVSERGELAENGEAANFGFFIDRENDLTSERDAGCPEGEFVGERKGVTFDLSLDLRMSLAETQDHATSLPALEEEEGALNGEIGVKGGRRAGPNGEPGGEACQPDAGRNSGEQPGSTLEQPTEVHLRIAEENGPPLALPERGPTDGQIASVDRPPPRPVPEAADVTVAATPEHVEGEHTPVRCPNPKREGRNAEGGSALGGGDALEEGGEPGPITSARRAVGMAVTSSEVMLIERFLAGEDLSGTEEKDPFQLAYVGGVKIRLKRRSLGLDEFRLGGVASETETEGEEDLLADLQTQAAAEGGGIAEGVGEQGGGLGETGAGVQLEGVTTGEEQETEGNLRDSVDNGMPTRAERRGGAEEGGGCCLREATGRLDEDMLGACGAVGGNGVDGAGVYDTGFAERIGGEGLNAGVLGSGEVVGHREQIAKLRLGSDSVEPRMDTAEKCHVAERQGRESGSDAAGVVSSPKVTVAEVHPRSDGSSGHEELDTQMGVATQQALARARAMLSGWTGPTAQPPVKTTPVPPSLEVQTVAANTCPGVLPDHETRLPEERTAEVQNWSEQSPGLAACEGHVPEEELRFSCGGPETQLALAKGRAVVRKWAPGLVSPVSGKGVGVERNVGGGRNESKGSENVTAKQEETDLGGGDAKETSRREGDGSGERAGKESERRWGVQGGAGAEGGECSEETRVQLDVRVDAGPSRGELGQAEGVEQQRGLADGGTAATRERLNGAREEESRVAVGEGSGPPKVGPANFAADRVGEVATDSIQVDERLEHAHGVAANNSEPGVGRNLSDAFVNTANKDGKDPQQLPAAAETLPEDDVALTSASRAEPQQPGSLAGDGQMEEAEAGGIRGDTERAEGTPPDGLGDFTTPPVMLGPFWAPEGGFPLGSTAPPSSGKRPCALWRVSETQNPDETPVRNGPTEEHVGSAGSPQGVPASLREGGFVENGPEGVGGLRAGLAAGLEGSATSKPDEVGARMVATEVIGNLGEPSKPSETRAAVDANGWRQKVTEARAPPEGLKGSGQTVPDCREDCPKLSGDPPAGKAQLSEPQPVTNEKAPRGSPKGAGWTQCLEYFQQQVEMGRVCTLPAYSPGGCVPMEKTGGVARRVESEPSPQKVANVPNEKVTAGGGEKTGEQFAKGKQGDELERGGVGGQLRVQEGGCGENEETGSLTVDDDVAGGWRKAVRAGGEQTRDGVPAEKEETHRNGGLGAVCAAAETNRHEKGGMDQALPSAPQHGAASPGGHGLQRSCSQSATPWPEICSVIGSEELPLFKPKPRVVYSAATKPAGEGGSVEDNEKEGGREEKSFVEVETQESVGVLIWQRRTGVKRARTFVIDSASEGREAERGGIHTEGEDALQGDVGNGGNGARKRLRKVGGVLLEDIEEEATWHHVEAATWHEVGERKGGGATKGIEAIASRWLGGWTPAAAPANEHVADLPSTPPQTPPRESPPTATQQSAQHDKAEKLDRGEPPGARQPAWKRDGFVESLSQPSQADFPPCASEEIPEHKPPSPVKPSGILKPLNPAEAANPSKPLNAEMPAQPGFKAPELVLEESPVVEAEENGPVKEGEVRRSPRKKVQEGRPGDPSPGGWRNREQHVGGRKEAVGGRDDVVGGRKGVVSGRNRVTGGRREPPGTSKGDKSGRKEGAGAGTVPLDGREKLSNTWANPPRRPLSQAQKGRVTFVRPQRHDFVRNSSQAVADVARRMREVTQRAAREKSAQEKSARDKSSRGKDVSDSDACRTRSGRPNKRPMDSQFLVYGEGRAALGEKRKKDGGAASVTNGFSELPFEGTGQTDGDESWEEEVRDLRKDESGDAGLTSGGLKWPEDRKRKRLPGSQESREKRPKGGDGLSGKGREKGHVAAGEATGDDDRCREKATGERGERKGKTKSTGLSEEGRKGLNDGPRNRETERPKSEGLGLRRRMRRKCFSKYKRAQKTTRGGRENPSERAGGGVTTRHGAAVTKGMRLRKGLRISKSSKEETRGGLGKRAATGSKAAPEGATQPKRPQRRTSLKSEVAEASAGGSYDVRENPEDVSGEEGKEVSPKRTPKRRVSFQAVSPASPARRSSAFGTQQAAAAIFEMAGTDVVMDDVSGSPAAKDTAAVTPRRSPRGKAKAGKPVNGSGGISGGKNRSRGTLGRNNREVGEGAGKRRDVEPDVIDLRGNEEREKKAGSRGPILSSCRENPASNERGAKKRKLSDIGTGGNASDGCHAAKGARTESPAAKKGKWVKSETGVSEEDGEPASSGPLFAGYRFLLTGLEAGQKEKLTALLTQHGGQILADIPEPPSRGGNLGADPPPSPLKPRRRHFPGQQEATVVVAGRPVRTPKFLYGCAVGAWPVRISWVSACVKAGKLVPRAEYESPRTETSAKGDPQGLPAEGKASGVGKGRGSRRSEKGSGRKQKTEERSGKELERGVFLGLHLHLHGSAKFRKTWADLVRHAGGHVCRSLEHDWAHAVLLEPGVDAPPDLKRAARRAKVSIKTLDWAVDALLSGNRPADFPNPPNPEETLSPKGPTERGQDSPQHPRKRRKSSFASSDKGKDPEKTGEPDHSPRNVREETPSEGGPVWEGLGLREPPPLPADALKAPDQSDARPNKRTYFSAVTSAGERYHIGDTAETQADGSASARIVQLMSLWESPGNGGEGCMRATCRLFMRPQDTEFPIVGGAGLGANQGLEGGGLQEVYLSSVVQEVGVSELRRKVHVARSTGGAGPSDGFLCRFFYDAKREILQKLKV